MFSRCQRGGGVKKIYLLTTSVCSLSVPSVSSNASHATISNIIVGIRRQAIVYSVQKRGNFFLNSVADKMLDPKCGTIKLVKMPCFGRGVLVKDQVWSEVQHGSIGKRV